MKSTRKTASTEIKYGEAGEKVGTLEERSAADAQLVGRWNELARLWMTKEIISHTHVPNLHQGREISVTVPPSVVSDSHYMFIFLSTSALCRCRCHNKTCGPSKLDALEMAVLLLLCTCFAF